jgi:hypothetical protein
MTSQGLPASIPSSIPEIHAVQKWTKRKCGNLFVLTASSVDDVTVAGGSAFVDDGIKTGQRSAGVARHAPESAGGAGHEGHGGRKGCDGLHG